MNNLSEFHRWTWLSKLRVEDFVCHYCPVVHLGCFLPSPAAATTPAEHSHNSSTSNASFIKGSSGPWAFHTQNFHPDVSWTYSIHKSPFHATSCWCFPMVLRPCLADWLPRRQEGGGTKKGMQAFNSSLKCLSPTCRPLKPLATLPDVEVLEPLWHLNCY